MQKIKKYIRLILGIILLLLGIGFMIIPFIPIGYIFVFVAFFFLATYIPALNRVLNYLKKKDKSGRLNKVEHKIEDLEEKFNGHNKEDEEDKTKKKNQKNTDDTQQIKIQKSGNRKNQVGKKRKQSDGDRQTSIRKKDTNQ